jgi:polar amino acid transport system substrate-binding protein
MTSSTTGRVLRAVAATALGLLVAACDRNGASSPAATAEGTAAPPARVYVVGTDAAYAPFESQNERGEIVGFDIDVVRAVAAKAGLAVKFVNTPWEGIFNALGQGDLDMVASAVTITEERRQTMDFTAPYFDARQLIAVKQSSPVVSFADLESLALAVGVQTGTTGDEAVSKLLGKTSDRIRRFESTPLALKELEAGGVDAVVADNGVVTHYVAHNPGGLFKTVSDPDFVPEQYGIAVRKGDAELLGRLNQGLAGIQADGSYDAIYARYFGTPPTASGAPAAAASAASR